MKGGGANWEDGWKQYLKEVWRGSDFIKLIPYFLAVSYDNPADFFDKPMSPKLLDGLPKYLSRPYMTEFEVSVPKYVQESDVLFYAVSEGSELAKSEVDKAVSESIISIPQELDATAVSKMLYKNIQ